MHEQEADVIQQYERKNNTRIINRKWKLCK